VKKILIFTSREGHLSLALATEQTLRETGYLVKTKTLLPPKDWALYAAFYRYFPFLFKIPYEFSKIPIIKQSITSYYQKKLYKQVSKSLIDFQPDLVISTYHLINPGIEKALEHFKKQIAFINLTTDVWNILPLEISFKANLNLFYDNRSRQQGLNIGLKKEKTVCLGWLVRKEFYKSYNNKEIRKKLGFQSGIFTLLICGGSEGTNMILKIIPSLLSVKTPLQAIFVCGSNRSLYRSILKATNVFHKTRLKQTLSIRVFGFSNQLAKFISISDLVIGKGGPNLIFESIAGRKPFFSICHLAGQEDSNLDLIKNKKVGLVEENYFKAGEILKNIINCPQLLNQYKQSINKERSYNIKTSHRLIQTISRLV
jgi:UDP-N-acetylglucosamine:LPS N-acetylglucosamine transferase